MRGSRPQHSALATAETPRNNLGDDDDLRMGSGESALDGASGAIAVGAPSDLGGGGARNHDLSAGCREQVQPVDLGEGYQRRGVDDPGLIRHW